jgi:hypothetical protein
MRLERLLIGLGLALVGCGDSTAPATITKSGSVTFAFTGAGGAGTFSASGVPPANAATSLGTTQWAAGSTNGTTSLDVVGVSPKTSTTWDLLSMEIPNQVVGSNAIATPCSTNCPHLSIIFGSTSATATSFSFSCDVGTGTVTVATITSTRVTGTFSGTGSCEDFAGHVSSFTVTGGTFDVDRTIAGG